MKGPIDRIISQTTWRCVKTRTESFQSAVNLKEMHVMFKVFTSHEGAPFLTRMIVVHRSGATSLILTKLVYCVGSSFA